MSWRPSLFPLRDSDIRHNTDHMFTAVGAIATRLPIQEKLLEVDFQMADCERTRNGFIEMDMWPQSLVEKKISPQAEL